ncbi:hypothetical protein ACFLTJ_03430 [Chloroflexota bacterium]
MKTKVSDILYQELMKIKESGEVDMQDPKAVLEYAQKHDFRTAARTIQGNPKRYLGCINEGMEKEVFKTSNKEHSA